MIGLTKLLCGTATVSDVIKYGRTSRNLPPSMLQFSSEYSPLVVWNMTNRCNLSCRHCYLSAEDKTYAGELTTSEAKLFIDELASLKTPVLLFSGGEPLLREDIFELGQYARERGIRTVLSTNGVLISPEMAKSIFAAGFQYVGVSIDGNEEIHDSFRGKRGAFSAAVTGIRNALSAGNKTGIRFTINKLNFSSLPDVLEMVEREKIHRFCMYHLVYAGRGGEMVDLDISLEQKRYVIDFLINKTLDFHRRGVEVEILTTDNHADGIHVLQYLEKNQPERVEEVKELLRLHGGCSAGQKMANVDPNGHVHACQFWGHKSLGNIKERKFADIWNDGQNAFLAALRKKSEMLSGRCGECRYKELCAGCRIRAEALTGNIWSEDAACYLTDWKEPSLL